MLTVMGLVGAGLTTILKWALPPSVMLLRLLMDSTGAGPVMPWKLLEYRIASAMPSQCGLSCGMVRRLSASCSSPPSPATKPLH